MSKFENLGESRDAIFNPYAMEWGDNDYCVGKSTEKDGPTLTESAPAPKRSYQGEVSGIFTQYIQQIKDIPILTREVEFALGEQVFKGRRLILEVLCGMPHTLQSDIKNWFLKAVEKPFSAKNYFDIPSSIGEEAQHQYKQAKTEGSAPLQKKDYEQRLIKETAFKILSAIEAFESWKENRQNTPANGDGLASEQALRSKLSILVDSILLMRPKDRILCKLANQIRLSLNGDKAKSSLEMGLRMIEEAKAKLYRSNLKLVVSNAKAFSPLGLEIMDLVQEGNVGLFSAVDKFDHRQGIKFSTYASWWIRQAILRGRSDQTQRIYIPPDVRMIINAVREADRFIQAEHGRPATFEDLVSITRFKPHRVRLALDVMKLQNLEELDASISSDDDSPLIGFLNKSGPSPLDRVAEKQSKQKLFEAFAKLTPKEEKIMRHRLEGLTLQEIGEFFGQTRANMLVVEGRAMRKLRRDPVLLELWSEGTEIAKPALKQGMRQGANGINRQATEETEISSSVFPRSQGKKGSNIVTGGSKMADAFRRALSRLDRA